MSYVENNLMTNEEVIYKAKIHWSIYVPAVVIFLLAIFLFGTTLGRFAFVLAVISFIRALITRMTTELAVTSKRVIAKIGLIRRNTVELNHSKVESFSIYQSIMGRILGFGTLIIHGTGGGKTRIPSIDAPLDFRRQAMQVIDSYQ